MTLIIAVASRDYVYLSADTRVTEKYTRTGKVKNVSDDYFKLWWVDGLYCAVAGDSRLATMIVAGLHLSRSGNWLELNTLEFIKEKVSKTADYHWTTNTGGSFTEATVVFGLRRGNKSRLIIIEVSRNGVNAYEGEEYKRYIFGSQKLTEDAAEDSGSLDDPVPGGAFALNGARIHALISSSKLTQVGKYITSLRIGPDDNAIFPSGKMIPMKLDSSGTLAGSEVYEVVWDDKNGWPYIVDSSLSKSVYLRPFNNPDADIKGISKCL